MARLNRPQPEAVSGQPGARSPGRGAASLVLVIDNYDSFTYNLVQLLGERDCRLEVYRNDAIGTSEIEELAPDRIVISPGPGQPGQAGVSVELVRKFAGRIPILGVCLGHQAIAAAFGGRVVGAPTLMHGKTSQIFHERDSILRGLPNPFTATRYHSLIVPREDLPGCLVETAWTKDGVLMGLRHRDFPVFGVQFHPESILTRQGGRLIENFLCCEN